MKVIREASAGLEATVGDVTKAGAFLKEKVDTVKEGRTPPQREARNAIVKLKERLGAVESKCKRLLAALENLQTQLIAAARQAVLDALRENLRKSGTDAAALMKKLGKKGQIPLKGFRSYLEKLPDANLTAVQLSLALDRFSSVGFIGPLGLANMVQEYMKCIKEISITTQYEINKDTKTIRKLAVDELVEILEAPPRVAADGALPRVRCRVLLDGTEGWVSVRGNQGSAFLETVEKPYYCFQDETSLRESLEASSGEVRKLKVGEVVEVVEGPKRPEAAEISRARVRDDKGVAGWVTLRDEQGIAGLEAKKLMICKSSIAITNAFDIAAKGNAIRKLEVGETIEILEGPKEDAVRKLKRVRAKATRGDAEGWVTMMGNQGTPYISETSKHYLCLRTLPLEKSFSSGGAPAATLEVGQVVEMIGEPKTIKTKAALTLRGRTLDDKREGWATVASPSAAHPWTPLLRVTAGVSVLDGPNIAKAKTVRKLEVGELLEALDVPVFDADTKILRVHARVEKDGVVGFVTVKGDKGTAFLESVSANATGAPAPQ